MTVEQYRSLIDQFDLREGEMPLFFQAEGELQPEWALLELAVEAIRLHAISKQVKAVIGLRECRFCMSS
jgi:hypothetical protein